MLEKIRPNELIVGKKTTFDIYAKGGRLLLSRGALIANEQQIEVLMKRGLIERKSSERIDFSSEFKPFRYSNNVNPFLEVAEFEGQLARIFKLLDSSNSSAGEVFQREIRNLASQIYGLAQQVPDALLGTIHWPKKEDALYSIYQPIQCACLVAIISIYLKVNDQRLFSTLAATLTANLGMRASQDRLNNQKTPLSDEQKQSLKDHPDKSVLLLESLGVRDPVWIRAVLHHHERLDGSGYPQQLKGNNIASEAKLLALTDIYVALISQREYRGALSTKSAIKQIFTARGDLVGSELTKIFLTQLGVYPPGTPVKLKNGDTAIVTKRGENIAQPIAAGIRAASGQVFMHPPPRDTSLPEYEIVEVLNKEILKPLQPFLFWGVHTRKAIEL